MKKPSQYFVPYEDQQRLQAAIADVIRSNGPVERPEELVAPTDTWRDRDFDDLEAAKAFAESDGISEVYERRNIREAEDAPGLWDWDEKQVWPV